MPGTQHGFTPTNWLLAVGPAAAWLAQAPAAAGGNVLAGNAIGGGLAGNAGAGAGGNALGGGLSSGSPTAVGFIGNTIAGNFVGGLPGGGFTGNALGGGLVASPGGAGSAGTALGGGLIGGGAGSGNALGGGLIGGSSIRAGATGAVIAGSSVGAGAQVGRGPVSAIRLSVDTDFVRAHLKWLSAWVLGSASPIDCALIACDFNRQPVEQLTFQKARVTRLTFTPLDASLRTPWLLGIELTPTSVQWQKGGGSVRVPPQQRTWTSCNDFELIIDGARTNKVAQAVISTMSSPGLLPTLTLRIPSNDVQAFEDWRRSGRTAACAINLLSPSGSPVLTLKFMALPTAIKLGGGTSSAALMPASVTLSPTRPSLA